MFKSIVIIMIMPITAKIVSIPKSIYLRLKTKFIGFIFIIFLLSNFYFIKKLRIKPPAITDAICPETLTPIECIRR